MIWEGMYQKAKLEIIEDNIEKDNINCTIFVNPKGANINV